MAKKVIPVANGFIIKDYDAKGNSKGVVSGVFKSEGEALDALSKETKPKTTRSKKTK